MENLIEINFRKGEFLQKFYSYRQEMVIYFFLLQAWVFPFFFTGIIQGLFIGLYLYALIFNTIRLKNKWKQVLPDFDE